MKYIIIDGVALSRPLGGPLAAHIGSFARCGSEQGYSLCTLHREGLPLVVAADRLRGPSGCLPHSSSTENGLSDHCMNTFCLIYGLGNVQIDGNRAKDIGIVAFHALLGDEKINHFPDRHPRCFVKIFVQSHRDVVGWCLRARPGNSFSLANEYLNGPTQRCLDRGSRNFAFALSTVRVTYREQRTRHMHRHVQSGASDKITVVYVPDLRAGRTTGDTTHQGRRCHTDRTKEW